MRLPLIRFGDDEPGPPAWWELLCIPIVIPIYFLVGGLIAIIMTAYWIMYPEMHAHAWDFGTPKQQRVMERYRARCARTVPVWLRVLRLAGTILALPLWLAYELVIALWEISKGLMLALGWIGAELVRRR